MQVREVMSERPEILSLDASIRDVACCMRDSNSGAVPIYDQNKLVGVVTDRDLTVRAIAEGRSADDPVRSVITDEVLYCFENDDVQEVLHNMNENQVQRLIVLNNQNDKDLVGIVSVGDIADRCRDDESVQAVAECCRHYH